MAGQAYLHVSCSLLPTCGIIALSTSFKIIPIFIQSEIVPNSYSSGITSIILQIYATHHNYKWPILLHKLSKSSKH